MARGFHPVRSTRKTCADSLSVCPRPGRVYSIRTHKTDYVRTLKTPYIVPCQSFHKTQNALTEGYNVGYFCTVYVIYLFIQDLRPRQPHRLTSGLLTINQILHTLNTIQNMRYAHFSNVKHINIIQKLAPSVLLS